MHCCVFHISCIQGTVLDPVSCRPLSVSQFQPWMFSILTRTHLVRLSTSSIPKALLCFHCCAYTLPRIALHGRVANCLSIRCRPEYHVCAILLHPWLQHCLLEQFVQSFTGRSAVLNQYCLTACGQWAVVLFWCTASLPVGLGQWYTFCALPHCLWAVGSGTPTGHCLTACGQWAAELLLGTASLPVGSGQWSFVTLVTK